MSGNGPFSSSSLNGGASWNSTSARRASKLGGVGSNSKRRRGRRTLLQSAKRRVLKCSLVAAIIMVFGLLLYNGSFFVLPAPSHDRGGRVQSSSSVLRRSTGGGVNGTFVTGVAEAYTDITTKGLYEEIEFKDVPGGVWTQGWNVQYRGNEWDREKLKVIVVPHSHNDPGWIRTVEEYYRERTHGILNTIVQSLKKDKRRKFIWEEMSFLERWWQDASAADKEDFKRLVKNGQLEIVGGGWVMNDEANSHYYAIIQQMIAGNLWLLDNVGVTAKNAWAIDPFGHSPTMAYLLRRMGFKNMLIQRTHYEVKKELARTKNLEFMWRQSWDDTNSTDMFCHMMPFYSYDIPHTCGPEPGVCCMFDYWRLPGVYGAERCPWGRHPAEITPENVKERAELILDQYKKKNTLYRSNTLLVPLGDDFRYITMQEAELQFVNLQKIFDYINSQPYYKASVRFGTLEDYFTTLRTETGGQASATGAAIDGPADSVPGFPTLSGDFFTYSDKEQDYWSGYFVSRPFYKAVDRVLEETLRGADILFTLTSAYCQGGKSELPPSWTSKLVSARRNLALFQHHDGVTGTAKNHVVQDYGERMHNALVDLLEFMSESVTTLFSKRTSSGKCLTSSDFDDLRFYEPEQARAKYDMLPVKTVVGVADDHLRRVVFFNSLEESVNQVVTVLVDEPYVCVFDSAWKPVPSQVSPEWKSGSINQPATGKHRLQWEAQIPALGLQAYFVAPSATTESCIGAQMATVLVLNSHEDFVCPPHYQCSVKGDDHVEITNQYQSLVFGGRDGLLQSVELKNGGDIIALGEELAFYSSKSSGAYLFSPYGEASTFVEPGGLVLVTKGPLMEEVYTVPKCKFGNLPVVRSARLFAGTSVQASVAEIEYYTMMDSSSFNDKELITRFKTGLNNKGVFYSDLNGFQTIRRDTLDKLPLQANYYPMPALAFIQCPEGKRFSIHSRQALGVASLDRGWLEVMLDRRPLHDDGRGLGHGIMDNKKNSIVFHLLLEKPLVEPQKLDRDSSPRSPSLLSHRAGAQLNYPLHGFLGRPEQRADIEIASSSLGNDQTHKLTLSPFTSDLPCDLHVVAMQVLTVAGVKTQSKRNVGLVLQRRGLDPAYGVAKGVTGTEKCTLVDDVDLPLQALFADLTISNPGLTSLNLVHDYEGESDGLLEQVHRKQAGSSKLERVTELIDLDPMEIKGYKFQLRPRA